MRRIALNCATTKRHTVVCPLYMERAIAYLRVSTQRQQRSGLGIEAQRAAIERFANAESLAIAAEFVEFESGKGADALDRRPQLAAAFDQAHPPLCRTRTRQIRQRWPATLHWQTVQLRRVGPQFLARSAVGVELRP